MKIKTNAKINLTLNITDKRADGYHLLSSVMHPINLCDTIELKRSKFTSVHTSNPEIPNGEKNICYKAAKIFFEHTQIIGSVDIFIHKNIPAGAGLGGGSSNAAGVLKALNHMFNAKLPQSKLLTLAAKIGADVPFFITNQPALVEGIGEIITPISALTNCEIDIIHPPIHVSTKNVFEKFDIQKAEGITPCPSDNQAMISALKQGDIKSVCAHLGNMLEPATFALFPEIQMVKEKTHAQGVCMSGSGSCIVAINPLRLGHSNSGNSNAAHNPRDNYFGNSVYSTPHDYKIYKTGTYSSAALKSQENS